MTQNNRYEKEYKTPSKEYSALTLKRYNIQASAKVLKELNKRKSQRLMHSMIDQGGSRQYASLDVDDKRLSDANADGEELPLELNQEKSKLDDVKEQRQKRDKAFFRLNKNVANFLLQQPQSTLSASKIEQIESRRVSRAISVLDNMKSR